MSRYEWSVEAKRGIIRYNYERGLTVIQCVTEMEPFFKDNVPNNIEVYKLYRELRKGNYTFVGFSRMTSRPYCRLMIQHPLNKRSRYQDGEEAESDEKKKKEKSPPDA